MSGVDETTRAIIDRITVHFAQPTVIPGGHHTCRVFYDCARLSPNDLARLAAQATGDLAEHSFEVAVGIAYTGIYFAAAIAGGREVGILQADKKLYGPALKGKRVIVTDDVVYSGAKMREAEAIVRAAGGTVTGFACIVDRSEGAEHPLDKPLWCALKTSLE